MNTDSTNMNPSQQAATSARTQRLLITLLVLTVIAVILALTMVTPLAYFEDKRLGKVVKSVRPAGRVVSVNLQGGLFSRTLVETDLGFYALGEGVSFFKNEALTLELRASGARYLCDLQHQCTELL